MSAKNILIGGGTGFIGKHLANLALSEGYFISNVSRMPGTNNVSWEALKQNGLPDHSSAVVNLAGQQFMDFTRGWTEGFKQNVYNSRVFTTKALADAINKAKTKPDVYVVVTGVGAYQPSTKHKYDEASPVTGEDFFSKLVVKWEDAANVDPPVRSVIIRSGVVLGGAGGMIKNMYLPFLCGLGGPIASGYQYLPWIHIDDLTRLIMFAIENPKVTGILNGVAPQVITNNEFTKALASALNRPAFLRVPETVLNLLLNKERAMIMTTGQYVVPKRTMDFGFEYKFTNIYDACYDCVQSAASSFFGGR